VKAKAKPKEQEHGAVAPRLLGGGGRDGAGRVRGGEDLCLEEGAVGGDRDAEAAGGEGVDEGSEEACQHVRRRVIEERRKKVEANAKETMPTKDRKYGAGRRGPGGSGSDRGRE